MLNLVAPVSHFNPPTSRKLENRAFSFDAQRSRNVKSDTGRDLTLNNVWLQLDLARMLGSSFKGWLECRKLPDLLSRTQ